MNLLQEVEINQTLSLHHCADLTVNRCFRSFTAVSKINVLLRNSLLAYALLNYSLLEFSTEQGRRNVVKQSQKCPTRLLAYSLVANSQCSKEIVFLETAVILCVLNS